ncbi:ATP-dependent DNA helicase [Paraferrimonas haliotis]|uniref:ATP-dependent DNA helicase n=1 Tax=Paraferrimonas haliotis TaxID=2013866 RepID=UPI000BA8DD36|nr:helicase C-terminal domain-containing protein [Paraferrimonas haliotis]
MPNISANTSISQPPSFTREELSLQYDALYQSLIKGMQGYRVRQQQKQIIELCGKAMRTDGLVAIQADTGVGKTLGYLLAALPFVTQKSKRLIVSTHTVALQTQLIEKDIPALTAHIASDLKVEIAKGANRYFCPKRAHDLLSKKPKSSVNANQEYLLDDVIEEDQLHLNACEEQRALVQEIWNAFENKSFSGDLDTCHLPGIESVQNMINRKFERCPRAKKCQFGDSCPYFKQSEAIDKADIVIANHSLTAIAAITSNTVLRNLEDSIVVFDEAHHVHDVYRDNLLSCYELSQFAVLSNKVEGLGKLLKRMEKIPALFHSCSSEQLKTLLHKFQRAVEDNSFYISELDSYLFQNFNLLRGAVEQYEDANQWLLPLTPTEATMANQLMAALQALVSIGRVLTQLVKASADAKFFESENLNEKSTGYIVEWNRLLKSLEVYVSEGISSLQRYVEFDECLTDAQRVESGLVRWINRKTNQQGVTFQLISNSVNIHEHFRKHVLEVADSVVFASATLKVQGGFNYFVNQLGLNASNKALDVAEIFSPFDYKAACFSAPLFNGHPNSVKHAETICTYLKKSINRHKSILVLFSSYRQMNEVYTLACNSFKHSILCQNDFSKRELIEQHKRRIDRGDTSILFGVDGLSEGLDLQQQYLTCVLIAKLPFPALSTPMFKHFSNMLEAKGMSSFVQQSLPICERKLIQSVGRLIRGEEDYGEVILLDPRVNTSRYGKSLLASIPMLKHQQC